MARNSRRGDDFHVSIHVLRGHNVFRVVERVLLAVLVVANARQLPLFGAAVVLGVVFGAAAHWRRSSTDVDDDAD